MKPAKYEEWKALASNTVKQSSEGRPSYKCEENIFSHKTKEELGLLALIMFPRI